MENGLNKAADGEKTSFLVKIIFRRNESWQGTITWLEENKTSKFRSVIEMLSIMKNTANDQDSENGGNSTSIVITDSENSLRIVIE